MPIWKKIVYGAGDSGFSLTSTALALLYLDFLVNVVGLDPRLAGLSIALGRIWDALNDLFIGNLSDRTRSRWGRRRPYLLFGAIPFGVAFIFMWFVPAVGQEALLLAFYTGIYMLFDTLFTLTNVPYVALTPELAPTYDGRTSLQAYRMAFSIGFGLVGAVVPLALVDRLAGPDPSQAALRSAYLGMAMILAVVSVIPILLTFATVRERPEFQELPQPSLRDAFHLLATNKAFLIAAGVYLLTWMPIDLIQFVLVFLIRDYFGLGGSERDLIFLLLFGVAVLALPLWVRAAARWDKVRAYQVGIAFLAGVLVLLSFTPPGRSTAVFILAALAGIGLSAAHVIPLAILPDCMDWDELRRNERNEGAYYSVVTLIQKMVGALTIALTGTLLTMSGYVAATEGPASQPDSALNVLRWLTGPLPAAIFVLGIVLVSFYPLTRQRHARILAALDRKRAVRRRASGDAKEVLGAEP